MLESGDQTKGSPLGFPCVLCPPHRLPRAPLLMGKQHKNRVGGMFPGLDPTSVAAHVSPFVCRMREASSRPKREYKPKPRETFDLGEPEQSNGGFPCTPAPKITGKEQEVALLLQGLRNGPLLQLPQPPAPSKWYGLVPPAH